MNKLKINFQLQELDKIAPFGSEKALSLHWFGLTDALLWINAGRQTIYEYTEEAQNYFSHPIRYNDYYLARFLEDFWGTFRYVGESIPKELYNIINEFEVKVDDWKSHHLDCEDALFDQFYDNEYSKLIDWYCDRSFDSGHLIGGPNIGCFRCEDRIKIVWNSSSNIWVSPKGIFEISYDTFILSVTEFINSFFVEMDNQVNNAVFKDWGDIFLDKKGLVSEHNKRKIDFYQKLSLLKNTQESSDWDQIMMIYAKMEKEMVSVTNS